MKLKNITHAIGKVLKYMLVFINIKIKHNDMLQSPNKTPELWEPNFARGAKFEKKHPPTQ